ncbi:CUB and zona pellucida-like domain-containing protein 1 [Sardina pilchardus]|uniref:CUB and zona pellucida-like domain-containing protein 1 n=1 Tax=Sardina pilchardus TaxID=27697 RepID=UPI002E10BEC4
MVTLNEEMYIQVRLSKPDSSLVLFLDTCVASPNPLDYADRAYYLLLNGCPRDQTYRTFSNGSQSYARFGFRAFKFLRTHESVYLQCKVRICPKDDRNWWYVPLWRPQNTRSLDSQHQTATVVLGPIRLKDVENPAVKQLEDNMAQVDV